jgi:hypothetical protein
MGFKVQYDKEAERRNLGEDIFQRDGVTRKIRFKAQSDNGTTKLHLARYLRLPLVHPKDYYKNMPTGEMSSLETSPWIITALLGR